MDENSVGLRVIRAEGVDAPLLGCYVFLNNKLREVVTPLSPTNSENHVTLPRDGVVELSVKEVGAKPASNNSVAFSVGLLQQPGLHWLPLDGQTYSSQLPTQAASKRLLVKVSGAQPSPRAASPRVLAMPRPKEDPVNVHVQLLQATAEVTRLRQHNTHLQCLVDKYQRQLQTLPAVALQNEVENLKKQLELSEKSRKALQVELDKALAFQLREKQRQRSYERLSCTPRCRSPVRPVEACKTSTPKSKKADDTEAALREYLAKFGVSWSFIRESENIYCVNKKKVYIVLKNGSLQCRTGGGFMGIQQFLESLEVTSSRSQKRRSHTFDSFFEVTTASSKHTNKFSLIDVRPFR